MKYQNIKFQFVVKRIHCSGRTLPSKSGKNTSAGFIGIMEIYYIVSNRQFKISQR